MRYLKLILLLFLTKGVVYAQGVKFADTQPKAGSKVQFSYDPKGTKFENQTDITCRSLSFSSGTNPQLTKIDLTKDGEMYKGEIVAPDSVMLVGLAFSVGSDRDEAPNGYILKYSQGGKVPAEAHLYEGFLYGLAGNYYLGLTLDNQKALECYERAFALKPSLEDEYLRDYLSISLKADKTKGTSLIEEKIAKIAKLGENAKETDFMLLINLYSLLKQKPQVDSIKAVLLQRYPTGNYAYNMDLNALRMEKKPMFAEHKANSMIATYKLDSKSEINKNRLGSINYTLARVFALSDDTEKFEQYAAKIENKRSRADMYNYAAWPLAEKNKNTEFAAKISKQSLDLIEEARVEPVPQNFPSKDDYLKVLDRSYAMFADTYALLLHNLGKDKLAATYQAKAGRFSDAAGNERYVMYLDLAGEKEAAFAKADSSMRAGKYTAAMKARLKNLYVSLKKGNDADAYLASIEKIIAEQERAEWAKKMINIPAPEFALKNLQGETVSLASLKGKIVILDYWATWCGPCVASFPGMQKAIDKYSGNPNVVFLFINTFQRDENREKVVTDFVESKKLNFNILYDTKNAKDPSTFDTAAAYKFNSIPTKFIIDGDGNIRFKAVGFSGSDENVVKEIDAMIGLLLPKQNGK